MDVDRLRSLLEQVKSGEMAVEGALNALRSLPFEDLGFARLDHHRALRSGFPEVIYCPGKTTEHIVAIAERLSLRNRRVLASRASEDPHGRARNIEPLGDGRGQRLIGGTLSGGRRDPCLQRLAIPTKPGAAGARMSPNRQT